MLLIDLLELKALLQIPSGDTSQDLSLSFLIRYASTWLEELLDRSLQYRERVEYYDGSGTQQLLLRARPVPNPQVVPMTVWVDPNGFYGSTSGAFSDNPPNNPLTYGQDYCLKLDDRDSQVSRSGILIRMQGNLWPNRFYRQAGILTPFPGNPYGNIKVQYTAGYTPDTLPEPLRLACFWLTMTMQRMIPLGVLTSENYQDRSVSYFLPQKRQMLAQVWSMAGGFRNWSF